MRRAAHHRMEWAARLLMTQRAGELNVLTYPREAFAGDLREMLRRPGQTVRRALGRAAVGGAEEQLVQDRLPGDGPRLEVRLSETVRHEGRLDPNTDALLLIGAGGARGEAAGFRRGEHGLLEPIELLRLPGPGMEQIRLFSMEPETHPGAEALPDEEGRYSRSRGALGPAFDRIGESRLLQIGCGRLGSRLAQLLVEGLRVRRMTLLDPDRVGPADPGEMALVTVGDIGVCKVEAVAVRLAAGASWRELHGVCQPASHPAAMEAAQASDLILCAADHDTARLSAAILAVLFHRPLVDAAAGIHGSGAERRMGFDVRLTLPGRCLLCLSGLPQAEQAARSLLSPEDWRAFMANRVWRSERAGSLASLSGMAAHAAVRALEDLYAGRMAESLWVRGEFHPDGSFTAQTLRAETRAAPCPLCALSGAGFDGLDAARRLLRSLRGGGAGHPAQPGR